MKAMVMAAGAGTRLHPLTLSVPKPMVPIANRPVLEYTINNLRAHGITEIILNLHSHPEMIRNYFKDGSAWGVKLSYSHEPKLMGTAGGVKKVASFLKGDTFLVMSGDGLTDVDLTELIAFHQKRRSVGTMALAPIDSRFEYGITLTDKQGRVTRFIEKPAWSDVFSNQVNTGIYVFESSTLSKIPAGRMYDFGKELWPKLLKEKARIYATPIDAYWCDVGNLSEYRRAQRDVLDGKIKITLPGKMIRPRVWVDEGAVIEAGVKIEGPCLIGKNSWIGRGSRIGAYTIIGNNARIGKNTSLEQCILWDNVTIANNVHLTDCVISHGARVTESVSVYEGAVIHISK